MKLGYSSRCGGVSRGPYAFLNLGYKWGDSAVDVDENRRRFLAIWEQEEQDLVCADQVHGTNVVLVNHKETGTIIPATDGLITGCPGVVLGAFAADCLLVYLWDQQANAIALLHAGWRGTLGGIAANAVKAMQLHLDASAVQIRALLAPCIKPCCYEVGLDVKEEASLSCYKNSGVFYPSPRKDHFFFDLQQTNFNILVGAGLQPENIVFNSLCTRCNPRLFYSYRRAGGNPTGSHMGIFFLCER